MASTSSKTQAGWGGVASTSAFRSPAGNSQVRIVPGAPVKLCRWWAQEVVQPLGPAMFGEDKVGAPQIGHALQSDRARHQASAVIDVAATNRGDRSRPRSGPQALSLRESSSSSLGCCAATFASTGATQRRPNSTGADNTQTPLLLRAAPDLQRGLAGRGVPPARGRSAHSRPDHPL